MKKHQGLLTSKMTSKGQVTIPKRVRDVVGFAPGDEVEFLIWGKSVVLRPLAKGDIMRWAGFLADRAPVVSAEGLREIAEVQAVREVLDLPDDWVPETDRRERASPGAGGRTAGVVREGGAPYRRGKAR